MTYVSLKLKMMFPIYTRWPHDHGHMAHCSLSEKSCFTVTDTNNIQYTTDSLMVSMWTNVYSSTSLCTGCTNCWIISIQVESLSKRKNPLEWKLCRASEKTRCKELLQHCHGNGEESMKCWSQSLKVTQSLHVLIIPLFYERNITFHLSTMKMYIWSF